MPVTVRAYGKLNLSLEITGLLPNSYHSIASVMQSVSLYNTVSAEKNQSGEITLRCDDKALPTDEGNVAFRAARRFLEAALLPEGAGLELFIKKSVPYQAGMGSASADAAGVLFAANELFGRPLPENELLRLAAQTGADIPFCLTGGAALAEGIGDILTPLPPLPDCAFAIIKPERGMSTPEAYRRFDALQSPRQPEARRCASAIRSGSLFEIAGCCGNIFEQCCDIGEVFEIKRALLASGALCAFMTGSGTAVFGLFEDEAAAKAALDRNVSSRFRGWLAKPVNRGIEIE